MSCPVGGFRRFDIYPVLSRDDIKSRYIPLPKEGILGQIQTCFPLQRHCGLIRMHLLALEFSKLTSMLRNKCDFN